MLIPEFSYFWIPNSKNTHMKKQLLCLSLALAGATASAQITLTSADIATPGMIILKSSQDSANLTLGPGGTNMTWSYTGFIAEEGATFEFKNPATMADFALFPSANLGLTVDSVQDAYLSNTASQLSVVGQAGDFAGQHVVFSMNAPEVILNFPATYGNTMPLSTTISTAQFLYTAQAGIDSIRVKQTKYKSSMIDAWGSLTSDLGTHNVLRVNETINQIDSIWAHSPGFPPFVPASWQFVQEGLTDKNTFSFWANGQGFPILEIDSMHADGMKTITWNLPSAAGVAENTNQTGKVYPNPATTNVNFDLKGTNASAIEIYNALGAIVKTVSVNGNFMNVSTDELSNGLYLVKYKDASGKAIGATKFYISK
jgi:hypothetical protein